MNETQRKALEFMRDRNAGCVFIGVPMSGHYVWPEDIRASEAVALLVVQHYEIIEKADFVR